MSFEGKILDLIFLGCVAALAIDTAFNLYRKIF